MLALPLPMFSEDTMQPLLLFHFSQNEWFLYVSGGQRSPTKLPSHNVIVIIVVVVITRQRTLRERHRSYSHGYLLKHNVTHARRCRVASVVINVRHAVTVFVTVIHTSNKDCLVIIGSVAVVIVGSSKTAAVDVERR